LHHLTARVISTPRKYADNAVLLLPHPKVKPRDFWLVLSSTAGHFAFFLSSNGRETVPWLPRLESVRCNLKQSEELTLVNGFQAEHPPAAQPVQSGSRRTATSIQRGR